MQRVPGPVQLPSCVDVPLGGLLASFGRFFCQEKTPANAMHGHPDWDAASLFFSPSVTPITPAGSSRMGMVVRYWKALRRCWSDRALPSEQTSTASRDARTTLDTCRPAICCRGRSTLQSGSGTSLCPLLQPTAAGNIASYDWTFAERRVKGI